MEELAQPAIVKNKTKSMSAGAKRPIPHRMSVTSSRRKRHARFRQLVPAAGLNPSECPPSARIQRPLCSGLERKGRTPRYGIRPSVKVTCPAAR
jgi:hypothetical protein